MDAEPEEEAEDELSLLLVTELGLLDAEPLSETVLFWLKDGLETLSELPEQPKRREERSRIEKTNFFFIM